MALSEYIKLCDSLVLLLEPLIEIVIHELSSDSIVYIQGSLSNRKIGDPSFLKQEDIDDIAKVVYPKINFDGKLVKSISVHLEEKWLLCINCDISIFSQMQALSKVFLSHQGTQPPKSLFKNDWQEKVNISIYQYLQSHNLSFDSLNTANKKALVGQLFEMGAFNEKNAADYVAKTLKLGRATIFKYLKELR